MDFDGVLAQAKAERWPRERIFEVVEQIIGEQRASADRLERSLEALRAKFA